MTNTPTYPPHTPASDNVEAEALAWVVQLNGDEVTEKDLLAFREWVRRSPAHEREVRELAKIWSDLNILTAMDEPIREADKIYKGLRRSSRLKYWRPRLAIGGGVLAAILAVSTISILPRTAVNDAPIVAAHVSVPIVFKSEIGEQQKHILDDGSDITLNTNSHIEIDFSKTQRTVRLLKGEALFSVAHEESRPFLVFADEGIVRAVGTEFSVRLKDEAIGVIVSEGSVELSALSPTKPNIRPVLGQEDKTTKVASLGVITAGQSAKIQDAKASVSLQSIEQIKAKHSWQDGNLTFVGEPLQYVVDEVGRYTDLTIIIDDPALASRAFGGVLKIGKTEQLFRVLKAQYGIEAISESDTVIRLRDSKQ